MRTRLRNANSENMTRLVEELRLHLSRPGLRPGKADQRLQVAALSIARDFRVGHAAFGEMAQSVVDAVRGHGEAVSKSPHGVRASDARLARALARYLDAEVRILAGIFEDALPGSIGHDLDCCRQMLVRDLETALLALEACGLDSPEYRWTASAREFLHGPVPIGPDETRLLRADFDDLFAQG